jgi:hypothetical protein
MPTLDNTANNAFPFPTAANNGGDFATGIEDFAAAVDKMWSSGTLAERPTTGLVMNQEYYATDTGQWFKYNGSVWEQIGINGTISTPTRVTGTAYQPNTTRMTFVKVFVATTADEETAFLTIDVGDTSSPTLTVDQSSAAPIAGIPSVASVSAMVPAGFYYKFYLSIQDSTATVIETTL